MRTNIDLDDKIVEEAFELSNAKTKKVNSTCLEEFTETEKLIDDLYVNPVY